MPTQSEHAGGESLLSQNPVLTAEAWDHRGFGLQPSQATPASSATRPAYVSASCPSRPHHPPIVAARPASHVSREIPGRCEGRGRAASASRRVRSPARGERHKLADGKIKLRAADNRVAAGRDLQDHELVAAAGAHGSQPIRSAELRSCAPVEAMCLSTVTVSLSTGGASARGATVAASVLRSESRRTLRRGPPRRRRRSRRQNARRDQRSSRTKISWHPANSISSGDDGRGSRRIGV